MFIQKIYADVQKLRFPDNFHGRVSGTCTVLTCINTVDVSTCVEALEKATERYACPEVFNTGQVSRYQNKLEAPGLGRVGTYF